MTIKRNDQVRAVKGEHVGDKGRVIQQPFGKEGITTVLRTNGRAFDVKAAELVVIGDIEEAHP